MLFYLQLLLCDKRTYPDTIPSVWGFLGVLPDMELFRQINQAHLKGLYSPCSLPQPQSSLCTKIKWEHIVIPVEPQGTHSFWKEEINNSRIQKYSPNPAFLPASSFLAYERGHTHVLRTATCTPDDILWLKDRAAKGFQR